MTSEFPQLNIIKFAHDFQSYFDSAYAILERADSSQLLKYILSKDINSQYKFSPQKRAGDSFISYLDQTYLTGEKEVFLSFFNQIIPSVSLYGNKKEWELIDIPNWDRLPLLSIIHELLGLIASTNEPNVFNLDFHFNSSTLDFRRKLDEITTELINSNVNNLEGDNSLRYQECVSDFLQYKRESTKENKLFYNDSLNKLKKVVENTLQNNYRRQDGTPVKLHKQKEVSNIIFDGNNPEFEGLIDYVIKNIHHEEGGQPKNFTEKEYVYLWLELNNILYLLNRYKK